MNKYLTTFALLFASIFSNAQSVVIASKIYVENKNCDNDNTEKSIEIELLMGEKYKQVSDLYPTKCINFYTVPKFQGKYRAFIDAEGYQTQTIEFEINATTKDTLNLGEIILLKQELQILEEVTVTGIKKEFITIEADKTTVRVKNNDILSNGTVYQAITKLPGILVSPTGDMAINGKNSAIYIDGIPSNISGQDLISFIQSLPANTVEKIEIISNPGASFDANTSGGIINIITQGKGLKGFMGTLNFNYGLNKNQKIIPSLTLNGRLKKASLQLLTGYNYWEDDNKTILNQNFTYFNPIQNFIRENNTEGISRFFYIKPSVNFKLSEKSNLILNYNYSNTSSNNETYGTFKSNNISPTFLLNNDSDSKTKKNRQEFVVKYKTELDSLHRTLEITSYYSVFNKDLFTNSTQNQNTNFDYSINAIDLDLKNFYLKYDIALPFKKIDLSLNTGGKFSAVSANSLGKYNLNNSSNTIFTNPIYTAYLNFDYSEANLAFYAEAKKKIKKLTLGAGLRWENFNLESEIKETNTTIDNTYSNFFPSFNVLYELNSAINLIANYSKKIALPAYSDLDPNNSGYFDQYSTTTGNPFLTPNYYNNYEFKITAFNYIQIAANYSHSKNINLLVYETPDNSISTNQTYRTYNNVNNLSIYMAIPIPFGIFSQGMKFFQGKNLDIDKMNYMYIFGSYNKFKVENYEYQEPNKPIWAFGGFAQMLLPADIKLSLQYSLYLKGTYQIYQLKKPVESGELTLSKTFFDKSIKTSLTVSDIFNTSEVNAYTPFDNLNINYYNKKDSRVFWLKLSYTFGKFKILKKENIDIETENKKIESSGKITPN